MRSSFGFRLGRCLLMVGVGIFFVGGCGSHKNPGASGAGVIIVDNLFRATCSTRAGRPANLTAALDSGPKVGLVDNAKFQFANIAPGDHTLSIYSAVPMRNGGAVWSHRVSVEPGRVYGVEITCGPDGSVSPSAPKAL